MKHSITDTFDYNVVYVYTIPGSTHRGRLKIGDATLKLDRFDFLDEKEREKKMRRAAKDRIDQQTQTADIEYELLHCELAITKNKTVFRDYDVHNILLRSGYEKKSIRKGAREWFEAPLETAIASIEAAKEGLRWIGNQPVDGETSNTEFPFRECQSDAIKKTLNHFKKKSTAKFLWNAKMRFGKTTAALQVAKEMKFAKTLIYTHRPAVLDGWFNDYKKIFADTNTKCRTLANLGRMRSCTRSTNSRQTKSHLSRV